MRPLTTSDRFRTIDGLRASFFVIFLVMFVITEIGRKIYRPYIYAHNIFDFWIADTIGNFTGTIAIVFFDLAITYPLRAPGRTFIAFITGGLIVYELVQYVLPGRNTCDWRDIIATIVAGALSRGMYELVYRFAQTADREIGQHP